MFSRLITFLFCFIPFTLLSQPLPQGPRLKELADKAGILLGVRTLMQDSAYNAMVEREFNTATTTWYPRWSSEGGTTYDGFNVGVNWLEARKMHPLCHLLFGPDQYEKAHIIALTNGSDLDTAMENRIKGIMQSNGNGTKVNVWNIVNEAFQWSSDSGIYWPQTGTEALVWDKLGWEADQSGLTGMDKVNTMHPTFIHKAFVLARKYTSAKLELRDNTIEFSSKKSRAFYQLVKHLKNSGTPLDVVGMQCHLGFGFDSAQLAAEIRKYKALGLEVTFTEVDMGRGSQEWNSTTADLQKVAYRKLITIALNEGVSQVHFWGLRDDDETWLGGQNPLLFNHDSSPKPAYYGVQEALIAFNAKPVHIVKRNPIKNHIRFRARNRGMESLSLDGRWRHFFP